VSPFFPFTPPLDALDRQDASLFLRLAVGSCGLLIISLAFLFILTTASLLYVMYNYREEKADLNVLTMGIAPEHLPSVDIFLPRYKEPWDLFKPTVEAALNLEYPGRVEVYVLDDGADADLRNALVRTYGQRHSGWVCRADWSLYV
jgi:cellulose synthase/poly-beta-1,6-N-acetylglucosamine synthase-like glycosyltransferase